eukprot:12212076-Alexandrium_andersonii.AAC.1
MSASLVGSEMCIRDSCRRPSGSRRSTGGSAVGPQLERARSRSPRERPVSYTHLTLPTICSV